MTPTAKRLAALAPLLALVLGPLPALLRADRPR